MGPHRPRLRRGKPGARAPRAGRRSAAGCARHWRRSGATRAGTRHRREIGRWRHARGGSLPGPRRGPHRHHRPPGRRCGTQSPGIGARAPRRPARRRAGPLRSIRFRAVDGPPPLPLVHRRARDGSLSRCKRRGPAIARRASRGSGRLAPRAEAVAAIDRLGAGRPERDARLATAAIAGGGEHLALAAVARAAVAGAAVARAAVAAALATRGLAGGAAGRTAAWLAEFLLGVELLVIRREDELLVAVDAAEDLVGIGGGGEQKRKLLLVRPQRSCLAVKP